MDDNLSKFWEAVKTEEIALLATGVQGSVTLRAVSPVYHEDTILIATSPESQKYQQMKENPSCSVSVGGCFMDAVPVFAGAAMAEENAALREIYAQKFSDAFDEDALFGVRTMDFIVLKPTRIRGWGYENGMPTGPFQYDMA